MQIIDKLAFLSEGQMLATVELDWDYKAAVRWEGNPVQKDYWVAARLDQVHVLFIV